MEFLIIGTILIVIVAAILFLPSKKSKNQNGSEDRQKEKPVNARKPAKQTKPLKATRKPSARQSASIVSPGIQTASQGINDDDLLGAAQTPDFADYGAPIPDESNSAIPGNSSAIISGDSSAAFASAQSVGMYGSQLNQNIPATEQHPEIKMDTEPINHSTRVRKRVHEESKQIKREQEIDPIRFEGQDLENFDTPTIDDIFADPEINNENYKEQLFASLEEATIEGNDVTGVKIIPEDIPQVSDDLEPIGEESKKEEEKPAEERAEELTDETVEKTVEDPVGEDSDNDQAVEPEEEQAVEPAEEQTEEQAEEQADQSAVEQTTSYPDDFVPGSVSFDNTGLKFPERPHTKKVSELLPVELQINYDDDDVAITIESPDVKTPLQKDGMIVLYNSHLYKNGEFVPWDVRYEHQLPEGEEIVVDTGIGIRVPHGFGIKLVPVANMKTKFGLELASSEIVSQREAAFSLKFTVRSVDVISYIAKNQPLIKIKIFKI